MKKQFDSLRPFEKRVVVGVAAALFVVLNFWFVFPHFSDWGNVRDRLDTAETKMKKYQAAIAQVPAYKAQINDLIKGDTDVPVEDQGSQFMRAVQTEEARSGVIQTSAGTTRTYTNRPYFVELSQTISVQSGEQQLVDFLYNLGSGPSLIRVRSLNLRTDPPRLQLVAGVTLVASYSKATPKPAPAAPGSTPATKAAISTANRATPIAK